MKNNKGFIDPGGIMLLLAFFGVLGIVSMETTSNDKIQTGQRFRIGDSVYSCKELSRLSYEQKQVIFRRHGYQQPCPVAQPPKPIPQPCPHMEESPCQ